MEKKMSRHPKIQYWDTSENVIRSLRYKEIIDRIKENGCFDTLCISFWSINVWDITTKPLIKELVDYAYSKGFKVPMQVFQKGFKYRTGVGIDDAAALVSEYECDVRDSRTVIRTVGRSVDHAVISSSVASELLGAYAFRKYGDGLYEDGSLIEITDRAKIIYQDPESLSMEFDTKDLQGYTVYVMTAHYYACIDLFSERAIQEYKELIDAYADVPICGVVLDEFKNLTTIPIWEREEFRERLYGKNFHRYFEEQTGDDLIRTMFDMRFCPYGKDEVRIRAINRYFDVFRHSTKIVETFVAEYSEKVFGERNFMGLHNTYHNDLQNDEIWQTCCNWWEVPRKYAQTDEDIAYPIRMGIAGGCRENLVYDMYYSPELEKYLKKAMLDARFGGRIHYHIITDWTHPQLHNTLDPSRPNFLAAVKPYEDKIELLNLFDPAMPKMSVLVVFGFPALCNWYPDYEARNSTDINGKLNITERITTLWNNGYLNSLVPSDTLTDGRVTRKDGYFDYCGHKFEKMLYLYPEYSKKGVLDFLQETIDEGYDLKILGGLTRDFDAEPVHLNCDPNVILDETADIPSSMNLTQNTVPDGCVLEDGSVVITNYDSIKDNTFCTYKFCIGEYCCEATFKGVFAVKLNEGGNIEKIAAGNLKEFKVNGSIVLEFDGENDYVFNC